MLNGRTTQEHKGKPNYIKYKTQESLQEKINFSDKRLVINIKFVTINILFVTIVFLVTNNILFVTIFFLVNNIVYNSDKTKKNITIDILKN